ncbi:hypothetical protein Pmar_PMAR015515 [Perkinsus marinus ATCC 50983]|uniref:C3H1-type domain-containing protein n=1 Tax=Perkinsus marinus (strain ATCC 50983 / TXsc) TaxID=423536 RepID=C5KW88_PERM5|nr:hypothetical protein Pmar_PMAR015515 [Perkinsus marinus ATCC 50983]EER11255.1 hypothetical protein Pmar_PMAR015515 [Perkinsus marinus ATCC 50983]|eukprot:XP_002779460.1 hypothetical protein Pmar_PMAR015515 [Perkinsus marinus ATCC 50983]
MGISTVGVLEAALEDKELTDELLRRCADGGPDGESETTTMTEVADAKSASSSSKSPGTASEVADANKNRGGGGGDGVVVVEIFSKLRKARFKAMFITVVKKMKNQSELTVGDKGWSVFAARCMQALGHIPSDHLCPPTPMVDRLRHDPLQYIELKVYDTGTRNAAIPFETRSGEKNRSIAAKSRNPKDCFEWLMCVQQWVVCITVLSGCDFLAGQDYLSRLLWLARSRSFEAAVEYDKGYRLALPQGVTRLRDTDPSLQVDSALGTYLRSNQSHELIAVALAKPAVSHSGILRPPSGKGIRRQGSTMQFGADTCRFTRQSCPFGRDCRYRKHFGDPQSKPYWQNGLDGDKDRSPGPDKRPRTGPVKDEPSRKNPKSQ